MTSVQIVVTSLGQARMVYDETVDLTSIGQSQITRGSHVEPVESSSWSADMSPVGGPVLGPFSKRSEALAAEVAWLHQNWLARPSE